MIWSESEEDKEEREEQREREEEEEEEEGGGEEEEEGVGEEDDDTQDSEDLSQFSQRISLRAPVSYGKSNEDVIPLLDVRDPKDFISGLHDFNHGRVVESI